VDGREGFEPALLQSFLASIHDPTGSP